MPPITRRLTQVHPTTAVLLLTVMFGAPSPALAALDMTGTWEGTVSCKDVTSGAVAKSKGGVTMTVTQVGNAVRAVVAPAGGPSRTYQGHVQELVEKPGQGAGTLLTCGAQAGSSTFAEILTAAVKAKPTDPIKATLKASSGYENAGNVQVGGVCKYSLKRTALADPLVAACSLATDFTYVISAIDLPLNGSEAAALGFDLDGKPSDGIDNQLGSVLGSFAALAPSLDLQASITRQVDQGTLVQLADITATDLTNSGVAGLALYAGTTDMTPPACLNSSDVVCRQQFSGSGIFVVDPLGPPDAKLVGVAAVGTFNGGPGRVSLKLTLGGTPITVPLELVRAELVDVTAGGWATGSKIGGAIKQTDLETAVMPKLATLVRTSFDEDCDVGGTPPSCGCVAGSTGATLKNLFDKAPTQDCVISDPEVTAVLSGFLTPDIDLDGEGTNDALSLGLGVTAVKGTFTPPSPP